MIPQRPSRDLLARAFEGFEKAAAHLETGQSALRSEVTRLERELLDAHRRLEAVLDALDTGVAVLSDRGTVLRSNRAFEAMDLDESCIARVERHASASARGGTVRFRHRTRSRNSDLALTILPVGDEDGSRVLTVQDVTEIRREEEEGGRRRRLEALGRMAAELAHEVRNPLGSIHLFASMLRDDLTGSDSLQEMAEQILEASAGLEACVSNLLAFASPSRARKRQVDLRGLAADACALLAPLCGSRGVELSGPGTGAPCPVRADPEGLRQIMLNLLGNALAATMSGGSIRVRVEKVVDRAVLRVDDCGRGIDPEDLPRVFDPFFSRTEGGTGLGLSVVYGIVERHGGTISLDSTPGRGARVRVELPHDPTEEKRDG